MGTGPRFGRWPIFYNAAGQQVTGGNLTDSPVAAYVEGTSTIRSGDSVATLYGYLPVNGQPTSEWSGEQLGLTTTFPNTGAPPPLNTATLPVETGNSGDKNIATLETDYPNNDHSTDGYAGMYQLRLYTNAPRQGTEHRVRLRRHLDQREHVDGGVFGRAVNDHHDEARRRAGWRRRTRPR